MVQWFDPSILADAALRVVLSSVFGAYSDKRETQAAIVQPPFEYSAGDDGALWIDFVADLGDGFDSTYSVASLLGRERLQLDDERTRPSCRAGACSSWAATRSIRRRRVRITRASFAVPTAPRCRGRSRDRARICSPSPATTTGTTA